MKRSSMLAATVIGNLRDPDKWAWCADWLAIAVAAALPWSTSITLVLIGLWCFARMGVRDFGWTFAQMATPAGGLPVALWGLAVIGTLWADVPWAERIDGLSTYHRFLAIYVLIAQFRRSDRALWVLAAFVASCTLLLVVSWALVLIPGLPWRGRFPKLPGIPIKDYIAQAQAFALCSLGLGDVAFEVWSRGRRRLAVALAVLALLFLANILYVAPSRTTLISLPLLLILLAALRLGWKGLLGALAVATALALLAWQTSPSLHGRVALVPQELRDFDPQGVSTSVGERLEFWRKSLAFIADAPIAGHGTGAMREQFRRAAEGQTGIAAEITPNPHNQVFAVAIQLGLVGVAVLLSMWAAHLLLFRRARWLCAIGLIVIVQNIVGSVFNSFLFDFTEGWTYVWGVGVLGGMAMRADRDAWDERDSGTVHRSSVPAVPNHTPGTRNAGPIQFRTTSTEHVA